MSTLTVFLYALVVVVSLLLIGIILIQPSKSGGMGAAFGGQAGSHLTRATVVMTAVFFLLTLVLASLIGHGVRMGRSDDGVTAALEAPVAAAVKSEAAPKAAETAK